MFTVSHFRIVVYGRIHKAGPRHKPFDPATLLSVRPLVGAAVISATRVAESSSFE